MNGVTAARIRPSALALARAVPIWAWLGGLVVASALVRYDLSRRMVAPWIFVDELIYSELAKSFAAGGHFLVRDHSTGAYGYVYPVLISPGYRLFGVVPDAYAAAKAINSLLMSLAAVPAYLLARRVLSPLLSLLAAVLAVAVPSMVYTGTLMTENAFYPLFLGVALALVLVLERPTAARQVVLLALSVLAFLTRTQAVALLPAILTAPLLLALLERGGRRGLAAYRALYGLVGASIAVVLAYELARGRSPLGLLGAYRAAGEQHYHVGAVARWLVYHVAELELYLGVVPFAALLALTAVGRRLPRATQAFLAASLALSLWLLVEVAAFASRVPIPPRVEERNVFYLAPLFLIALLVWLERGARRTLPGALAVLAAAALVATLPFSTLIGPPAVSDTLALLPWWWLQDHVISLSQVRPTALVGVLATAGLLLVLPRRLLLALPALVLAYFAVVTASVESSRHGIQVASAGSLFQGIKNPERDWIDRAVGRHAQVAAIWSGNTSPYSIWQNEFFNRSVGAVYRLTGPLPGGLPETPVQVERQNGLILGPDGRPVRARYALSDGSVTLAGVPVAQDPRQGLALYRVDGPLVSTTQVTGLYPSDTWSGARVSYRRLRCAGGVLTVELASDTSLFRTPQTIVARIEGRVAARARLAPSATRELTVPLRARGGRCAVVFTVSPTAVPTLVTRGANPDPRVLGVHFLRFTFAAARGT